MPSPNKPDSSKMSSNGTAPSGGVRFAPSPTGRFHLGNLRTAWISYAWARAHQRPWVVRFEDIDKPRVKAGAQETQLADMQALGLVPDEVHVQSETFSTHQLLFQEAVREGRVYPCDCSRKDVQEALASAQSAPHLSSWVYSGHCRERDPQTRVQTRVSKSSTFAWRFRMPDPSGRDDFIIARTQADEFSPSYHWACAIDDHIGRYSLLVRAVDLASSAPLQRAIQAWLCEREGRPTEFPAIFHTALVTQNDGHRLEKRTAGVTLPEIEATGLTPESLIERLKQSFDMALLSELPALSSIVGEARAEIRLRDLLPGFPNLS